MLKRLPVHFGPRHHSFVQMSVCSLTGLVESEVVRPEHAADRECALAQESEIREVFRQCS